MTTESVQFRPSPRPRAGAWAFIGGAWLNRRYTRLSSSIILGVLAAVVFIVLLWPKGAMRDQWEMVAMWFLVAYAVVNAVFYPLVRETYYRLTQPIREGAGPLFFGGLLLLLVWAFKFWLFCTLWMVSSLVGIFSFAYLAIGERRGRGWRID